MGTYRVPNLLPTYYMADILIHVHVRNRDDARRPWAYRDEIFKSDNTDNSTVLGACIIGTIQYDITYYYQV